jgi:hypothetical protein
MKPKVKLNQVIVGTYEMGYERVQLVLREGLGGEFYLMPGDIDCPRIKIGADHGKWGEVLACLLHEAGELSAERQRCRFSRTGEIAQDVHAYLFIMSHPQFSEVQALTAEFVANCWYDLKKAWTRWRRKEKI